MRMMTLDGKEPWNMFFFLRPALQYQGQRWLQGSAYSMKSRFLALTFEATVSSEE